MVKQITQRFKVRADSKTFYSHTFYDAENDLAYFSNGLMEESRFVISRLWPGEKTNGVRPMGFGISEGELESLFLQNDVSFLFGKQSEFGVI